MGSNLWWIGIMRERGVLPGRSWSSSVESTNQRLDPLACFIVGGEGSGRCTRSARW